MSNVDIEHGAPAAQVSGVGGRNIRAVAVKQFPLVYFYHHKASVARPRKSWIVPLIVLANAAMFGVTMYVNNCPAQPRNYGSCFAGFLGRFSFQPQSENYLLGPSKSTLTKLGALEWDKLVNDNENWRLLTSIWLHSSVVHLLTSMFYVAFIGIWLERQFGFFRIGSVYFLSGLGGSMLSSILISKDNIAVGASGASSGLSGAMLSELIINWTLYTRKALALYILLIGSVIISVLGLVPGIDKYYNLGGYITGFLAGFLFLLRPHFGWLQGHNLPRGVHAQSMYLTNQFVLALTATLLLVSVFVVALLLHVLPKSPWP